MCQAFGFETKLIGDTEDAYWEDWVYEDSLYRRRALLQNGKLVEVEIEATPGLAEV